MQERLLELLLGSFLGLFHPICFIPLNSILIHCLPKSAALIAIIGGIGPEFKEKIIPV